ncbi:3023_t:CDS:1 [Funneliformis caledonium]|uniref:3023_t:CDS:1 n=1 Tax=Funneliformis caledonium TaxID=1117310 RepID=A0A9N8Z1U2_9GLOM|nr:3023_t:CDS:1 [Funneliformis caledonium]
MTEKSTQQKEFVFISVDGKQTKNIAITPPENLKIEFPPKFTDSELGRNHDKKSQGKSKKPPNAFILFRKKYVESLHRLGHRDAMKKVSGWARDAWNKLPQEQKEQYEQYANKAAKFYQEWEIKNPQLVRQKQIKKPKKNSQPTQSPKPIVQTQAMPVQFTTQTTPPELTEVDTRNYYTFDEPIYYPLVYEQTETDQLYSDYSFYNNLENIPTTDINTLNYYYDFFDILPVPVKDNSQLV